MTLRLASVKRWIIFVMLGCLCLRAADMPAENPSRAGAPGESVTNTPLKQIRPGVFELGQVRLDKDKRTVSFPALVNLREGNIEYVVVTATGKTHESLLRTTAEPYHLQLAFLLLGAKGAGTNSLSEDPTKPLPGDKVEIEFSWNTDGKTNSFRFPMKTGNTLSGASSPRPSPPSDGGEGARRAGEKAPVMASGVAHRGFVSFRAEEFVQDRKASGPARRGNWIYTGSRLREEGFAAQLDGSIVSLITDADALINNSRPGREDDDNWLVRTNNLPPLHSPVEVTIRLVR